MSFFTISVIIVFLPFLISLIAFFLILSTDANFSKKPLFFILKPKFSALTIVNPTSPAEP